MYEVNLRTEPGRLLDWDAPLSAQPAPVRGFIENARPELRARLQRPDIGPRDFVPPIGQSIYQRLRVEGEPHTILRDAGIPGIQYFDQGSRAAGQGSRNYVIFPGQDEMIEILRRYGLMGPVVVGTGASLFSGGGEQ